MTKAQATQRIWKLVAALLDEEIVGGLAVQASADGWGVLNKRDRERLKEAAHEVSRELHVRASQL